ncbi:MAG: hypothetical protein A2621_04630 [Alphaproteobacteria bacterium RIFCSPHIGHO2_01_FULL_41_14]|nr:MAG: hypothetical protein A2065_00160 [Alphaproteobacteria bacterium GWB1_45_5]OFW76096.1 MAG: hypothetical protein A3K20_03110 [Alphaproteobacteria bacterium GWA1_45_9]OFW90247.1 MAG: hypothetical protein A2621_04630 [Alphaproteobacteria bacterium RIFCSPHIGHO2_01_FULL_41_14]
MRWDLLRRKWFLPAVVDRTFPVAVKRKRFLALLFVFILGILSPYYFLKQVFGMPVVPLQLAKLPYNMRRECNPKKFKFQENST